MKHTLDDVSPFTVLAVALTIVWSTTAPAFAAVPPAIAALLPKSATGATGNWSAVGTMTMGDFHAGLRGIPPGCDITVGSEVRLHLKNVTGMAGPLLTIMQQQQDQTVAQAKTGSAASAILKKKERQVTAVSEVIQEAVGGGQIVYYEYTEDCAKAPNHRTTMLRGFARKGTVFAQFELIATAPASEARALAIEILTNLQQFTPPPASQ